MLAPVLHKVTCNISTLHSTNDLNNQYVFSSQFSLNFQFSLHSKLVSYAVAYVILNEVSPAVVLAASALEQIDQS